MLRIATLIAVVSTACADTVEYPGPPELVLGVGRDALLPLADGDAVPIGTGLQGGTVLWGAVSARYLDPHELELVFTVTPPEGAMSFRRVKTDLEGADGGFAMGVTLGQHVFLPDVDKFAELPCVWRVEAIDREGRTASDEKIVIPTRVQ